ncbi:cadherin-related family member 2 [Pygocentrus nattereri]|uniref:Cadherin domain-containing protein n=1 Tax=Pygocentrus nattereri TaxID=42514 RepID=A0A3B4C4W3_PYGNA|nr:cadherin-related family member 2 [Pygocentrus nattereri]
MGILLFLLLDLFAPCYSQTINSVPIINMTVVQVREDLRAGAFAFQIEAYDPDGDKLTYGIRDPAYHFSVNKDTGQASINNTLDRETQEYFRVEIIVSDGVYETSKEITIIVLDANDNAPTFQNLPYNVEVEEDISVHTTVLTVLATDPDLNTGGIVSYKIDQVIPLDGTSVFSISDRGGDIVLNEPLSFTSKSAFYQIKINASDGGGPLYDDPNFVQSTATTAFITVVDVPNLDPQFLNLPNLASVDENSPVGTSVFKVQARDPDTGINDIIYYSIEDTNAPDLFQIDRDDGVVSVLTVFDREELLHINALVELTIKATEAGLNVDGIHANTMAKLQVNIGDVNDNQPRIYKCDGNNCVEQTHFTGDIDEHSSVGLSVSGLNMTVKDPDLGENSRFMLRLQGTDKDAFSVSPISAISESAVLILVKDPIAIDYEKKKVMIVEVVATDATIPDFVSTATVTIQINDINDNIPEFEEQAYKLSVEEHCANGTIVGTVTATDADELDEGLLTYRLLPESMLPYFDVYTDNGTIYVKNGNLLDRERTSSYSPTLQARDSGSNVGSTVLEITILDINDQTPQFYRDYQVFIRENNVLKLQVEARDDDEPNTPNSKIQYGIEDSEYSGNFTIDKDTGMITSIGILDREAIDPELNGVIELNVTATDMGVPPLSSWVIVVINVDDVNDNPPVYLDPDYTFHVKEGERGILVGYVRARDADQTEYNNRISFRITSGSQGNFLCISEPNGDGYRGVIRVDPDVELDYESDRKNYTLMVEATDLGQHTAMTTVEVVVEDVNDTPPVFPSGLTMSVEENSPPLMEVGVIEGSDADTNHSLIYELVSTKCHCNKTWEPCEEQWFILEPTGIVRTSADYNIDYEKCNMVDMTARVVDLYTEKGRNSTEGTVMINIVDVNDNAPEFIPVQEFFVVLSENVEQGTSVASVYATDRDSGENAKITFQVEGVEFDSTNAGEDPQPIGLIFYAETNEQPDAIGNYNGVIRSHQTLDPDRKGKYLVRVKAINLELSTEETIELITVDKSFRVGLRFESPVAEVNANLPYIRGALTGATKAMVHVVKVSSETTRNEQRKEVTLLEAYFVFPNGTALDSDSVVRILNTQDVYEQYGVILQGYGLTGILTGTFEQQENKLELFIMIGLVVALLIVVTVMSTSLVCVRRSYKRKLKAANAMNSAAMVTVEVQKAGPVVPGTNKYTREGANPVLNLNIDSATDLGFDEDGSSADRESLNSLDYNIDLTMTEKGTMPMTIIAEEEEDMGGHVYTEPLGAALAQRGKKGPQPTGLTIANPSLSTTDL